MMPVDEADEALLLDLLNTTSVLDGAPTDLLARWPQARTWMRERGLDATTDGWHALLAARPVLQAVARGERSPAALSPLLSEVRSAPAITDGHVEWSIEAPAGHAPVARCVLAWDRLQRNSPPRLRPCANTECRLFLIDRSKPNTARWCSMAVCGNRMKARRHHLRQRES